MTVASTAWNSSSLDKSKVAEKLIASWKLADMFAVQRASAIFSAVSSAHDVDRKLVATTAGRAEFKKYKRQLSDDLSDFP